MATSINGDRIKWGGGEPSKTLGIGKWPVKKRVAEKELKRQNEKQFVGGA